MRRPTPDRQQLPAATSKAQNTYVKAAPGSGKTFLSVERFGWLRYYHLRDESRGIAAVSFARSASAELRSRITQRWGGTALSWPALASTFDELLRSILRDLLARELLHWPGGRVQLEIHETWRRFPNTKQQGRDDSPLRAVADAAGNVVSAPLGGWPKPKVYFVIADRYLERLAEGQATHDEVRSVLDSVMGDGDLDLTAEIGRFLSTNFAHLIVDEAFDLNRLDGRVLAVAAEAGVQLTLVGDPWQSIFEWRGSAPRDVERFIEDHDFVPFEVVSSHRYKSDEMKALATRLVRGEAFQVSAVEQGRLPNVVLADRWRALWCSDELPILPCGLGRVDRTTGSAALTLLLNDLTLELFNEAATDVGNASAALGWDRDRRRLVAARTALADTTAGTSDVWAALRSGPASEVVWREPGGLAGRYLETLMERVRSGHQLVPGLTVHQAKGREWPHVDYLTDLLPEEAWWLDRDNAGDRRKYVALTRAEYTVRVRPLPQEVRTQMYFEGLQ